MSLMGNTSKIAKVCEFFAIICVVITLISAGMFGPTSTDGELLVLFTRCFILVTIFMTMAVGFQSMSSEIRTLQKKLSDLENNRKMENTTP